MQNRLEHIPKFTFKFKFEKVFLKKYKKMLDIFIFMCYIVKALDECGNFIYASVLELADRHV